jgi:hypothetical protein
MDEYEIKQKSLRKQGWLNMLAGAHQQAAEEFTFGQFLEEKVALYEAYKNDQGYSSMV